MQDHDSISNTNGSPSPPEGKTTSLNDDAVPPPIPYSAFSKTQRRFITLLIGLAMMFSPLSANIYLPCLPLLQAHYQTSQQLINITITAYIVLQGVAPAFFGELSDKIGRRPVYLLSFSVYVAASFGLAVQNSYSALLVLRMLQSLGASATVAIGYGVVADVAAPAERGSMLGPAMVTTNLGPVLGPLIGGPLSANAGWRWVFWFLSIAGGIFLLAIFLFLPETCRRIVGNGSIDPGRWNKPLLPFLSPKFTMPREQLENRHEPLSRKIMAVMPNPLKSVRLIFEKDTGLILSVAAMFYMAYYIVQASLPGLFVEIYGFNGTEIGLSYLAISCGVILGGFMNAKVMDYNYKRTAASIGFEIDKVRGDDLSKFPIERARVKLSEMFVILRGAFILGYGWALQGKVHVAVPLIMQFFIGLLSVNQTFNTLLVETHRESPSTAAASGNITRCALAAGGVAVMQPLLSRLGDGPFFTLLAGITGFGGLAAIYLIRAKGMEWRLQRESRKMSSTGELTNDA